MKKCKFSKFALNTDGVVSHLVVDGVDMSHALSVTYSHDGEGFPILTVVLPVEKAEILETARVQKIKSPTGDDGRGRRTIGSARIHK